MQRSQALAQLAAGPFDVAVIGGGIYGVAIAWKAAASGLRVALFERADFGSGTSSNSLRTIHGGLRYLQHVDLRRMRQSIRARREWLREFPDYIVPVQCSIPTFRPRHLRARGARAGIAGERCDQLDRNVGVEATQRLGVGIPVAGPAHSSCSARPVYAATTAQRCGTTGCASTRSAC
jgi:glycerol-3-phosphate dehydrogenase